MQQASRVAVVVVRLFCLVAVSSCAAVGCRPPPTPPATSVAVHAQAAETGLAVPNVEIVSGSTIVARTNSDGRATLDVTGAEGAMYELAVRCPKGFLSPSEALTVRRLSIGSAGPPEYAVTCHATRHNLVVAIRADGGANLPVLYMGKQIAQTDRSGSAHVAMETDVHERVELMIATREGDKVHPRNPTATFEVSADRDEIQFFEIAFTRDVKKKVVAPSKPSGPVEMGAR